jgi:thiamine biosynthesis protein ThiI
MTATQDLPPSFHPSYILVHYDEIALKKGNRRRFEDLLLANVRRALAGAGAVHGSRLYGRLLVSLAVDCSLERAAKRLERVFGVSNFVPCLRLAPDLDAVEAVLGEHLRGLPSRAFAVQCRRANKSFPQSSVDVNRRLGAHVQSLTGWPVRLDDPDLTIHLYLLEKDAYLGYNRIPGPGGLPTGSAGRVVCLLSGGIDSPVAAHRLMRRGAEPVFVHFHSAPHTSAASQEKVRELARRLLPFGHRARLYLVPFAELQRRIVTECPAPFRVILYRRFMVRAAESIARRERALALVTGESLGQVASQTLENLHTINCVATLPVLRPLIGTHKVEIVGEARRVGTFETSIEPHEDCCSFLMPQNPATYSSPRELDAAEKPFDVAAETQRLVEASSVEDLVGADGEPQVVRI